MRFRVKGYLQLLSLHATAAIILAAVVVFASPQVQAQQFNSITYEGSLVDSTNGNPANLSGQAIEFSIVTKAGTANECILYQENAPAGSGDSQGNIIFQVGTGTTVSGYSAFNSSVFTLGASNGVLAAGGACTYSATDARSLRVVVGSPTFKGYVPFTTVPYAADANSINGILASQILQTDTSGALSQANLANVFTTSNYGHLTNLLANEPNYVIGGSPITTSINTTGTVAADNLQISGATSGSVTLQAPSSVTTPYTLIMPTAQGSSGSYLTVGNGGQLTWAASPTLPSATSQLDSISTTQGAILYRNNSAWVALNPGTAGLFLQTGGATANPTWASAVTGLNNGSTGTAPNWAASGTNYTLNIPMASAASTTAGLLSNTDYTTFNGKLSSLVGATLAPGNILVGGSSGSQSAAPSGDLTMSSSTAGQFTIANNAVSYAKMQPTSANNVLLGHSAAAAGGGAIQEITIGSGLTLINGTLSGAGGSVTTVTASAPIASSGGTTPNITIAKATSSSDGYLASTDFTTFNGKLSSSLATGDIFVGVGNTATATAVSGDISLSSTNAGKFTVAAIQGTAVGTTSPTATNDFLRYNGTQYVPSFVQVADVRSMITGNGVFPTAACAAGSVINYNTSNADFECATLYPNAATGGFLAYTTTSAQPTFRSIGYTDLPTSTVSAGTHVGSVTVNAQGIVTGTANVTTLAGYGITDSVQNLGSVTGIKAGSSSGLGSAGTVGRLYIETDSQAIYYDTGSSWVEIANNATVFGTNGTVTNVSSANGDIGVQNASSTPTLTLNSGTGASQIVKLNTSAQLPAVDGSLLTNLNASSMSSGTMPAARMPAFTGDVTTTAGALATTVAKIAGNPVLGTTLASGDDGKVLRWSGSSTKYSPTYLGITDIHSTISTGTAVFPTSACSSSQTLEYSVATDQFLCTNIAVASSQVSGLGTAAVLNTGTAANNVVQWASASKYPAGDGTAITGVALTSGQANGAAMTLGTSDNYPLTLKTNNATALTINTSGLIGVRQNSPKVSLDMSTVTDALALPTGTTAQEPTGGAVLPGEIRYNTTQNYIEWYNGTAWVSINNQGNNSTLSGGIVNAEITVSPPSGLAVNVTSGGISNVGGLNNNSSGITNAGTISGVTSLTAPTTTNLNLGNTTDGTSLQIQDIGSTGADFVTIKGSAVAGTPVVSVAGTDTNISLGLAAKGTGSVAITNGALAVNSSGITGAAAYSLSSAAGAITLSPKTNLLLLPNGATGNVGINTSNPSSPLHIASDTAGINNGVLSIGGGIFGGGGGTFAGSSSGTEIAVNAGPAFSGNLIDLQKNGSTKFSVDSTGVMTAATSISAPAITTSSLTFSAGTNVAANEFLASPSTAAGVPTFRAVTFNDLGTFGSGTLIANLNATPGAASAWTVGSLLDFGLATGTPTQGMMLVRGSSSWTNIAPGPSGAVLTSTGTTSAPTFQTISLPSSGSPLATTSGGTGLSNTPTLGAILVGTGTGYTLTTTPSIAGGLTVGPGTTMNLGSSSTTTTASSISIGDNVSTLGSTNAVNAISIGGSSTNSGGTAGPGPATNIGMFTSGGSSPTGNKNPPSVNISQINSPSSGMIGNVVTNIGVNLGTTAFNNVNIGNLGANAAVAQQTVNIGNNGLNSTDYVNIGNITNTGVLATSNVNIASPSTATASSASSTIDIGSNTASSGATGIATINIGSPTGTSSPSGQNNINMGSSTSANESSAIVIGSAANATNTVKIYGGSSATGKILIQSGTTTNSAPFSSIGACKWGGGGNIASVVSVAPTATTATCANIPIGAVVTCTPTPGVANTWSAQVTTAGYVDIMMSPGGATVAASTTAWNCSWIVP